MRSKRVEAAISVVALLFVLAFAACSSGPATAAHTKPSNAQPLPSTAPPVTSGGVVADVIRVIDGDTIVVAIGGARGTKVRLIGIDTPGQEHCLFWGASERMRTLVEGKRVRLIKDVSETDQYDRLLRYVYVDDVFVNGVLVREGFAEVQTVAPDVLHAEEFAGLERAARSAHKGLWQEGTCPP